MTDAITTFSEEAFNDALSEYYKFRKEHPYYYLDWRTNGENAYECKKRIEKIAESLRPALDALTVAVEAPMKFALRVSSGASYFPKNPWIAILFGGETPTRGVYPVCYFYGEDEGFIIGCTESIRNPQQGFSEQFARMETIADPALREKLKKAGVEDRGNLALTQNMLVLRRDDKASEKAVRAALKDAIDVYCKARGKTAGSESQEVAAVPAATASTGNWYREVQVTDFRDWFYELAGLNGGNEPHWVFRGQGFSNWSLESSLGRKIQYGADQVVAASDAGAVLELSERVAIAEFAKEAKADRKYGDFDDLDLLALMQHYEGKTRLLDFSFAPTVALFWATRQNDGAVSSVKGFLKSHEDESGADLSDVYNAIDGASICVWAINLDDVLHDYDAPGIYGKMDQSRKFAALAIGGGVNAKEMPNIYGVDVVRPQINNARITVQDGLFLMARSLGKSFEENLKLSLPDGKRNVATVRDVRNADWIKDAGRVSAIKFVLNRKSADEARAFLSNLRITYQTIYPDLPGLAKGVAERIIDRQARGARTE